MCVMVRNFMKSYAFIIMCTYYSCVINLEHFKVQKILKVSIIVVVVIQSMLYHSNCVSLLSIYVTHYMHMYIPCGVLIHS